MLAIFALLALSLGSYIKPFLVMAIIPFSLIGVVLGHLVLGVPMSAASFSYVLPCNRQFEYGESCLSKKLRILGFLIF